MRSHSSRRLILASFALAIGLAGCASAGGSGDGDSASRGGGPNRILLSELSELQQLTAYQAIQRLRPRWLQPRGSNVPTVYVDGTRRQGGLEALRSLPVTEIEGARYLSGSNATTRFGTGNEGGAILITTRR